MVSATDVQSEAEPKSSVEVQSEWDYTSSPEVRSGSNALEEEEVL